MPTLQTTVYKTVELLVLAATLLCSPAASFRVTTIPQQHRYRHTGSRSFKSTELWMQQQQNVSEITELTTSTAESIDQHVVIRRTPQVRSKTKNRKPRNYWLNITNLEFELQQVWIENGAQDIKGETSKKASKNSKVVIPNETLLNYWRRNDLRAAIASHGGREILAEVFGVQRTVIVPGKWSEAIESVPVVHEIVNNDPNLTPKIAPLPPQQARQMKLNVEQLDEDPIKHNYTQRQRTRWSHQPQRKEKHFWNFQKLIEELFSYVDDYREKNQRPAVWMPRASELRAEGRSDLQQALVRFGGARKIGRQVGMVSFRDWWYFEGLLILVVELKEYLDEHYDGNYRVFPPINEILDRNPSLARLLKYYGGRKIVAGKLGMKHVYSSGRTSNRKLVTNVDDIYWGPLDLEFAIDLLTVIRNEHMQKEPPMKYPYLQMPTPKKLQAWNREDLDAKIQEYGGYENVARRLGLVYFIRKVAK